jgi:hypothetical protein
MIQDRELAVPGLKMCCPNETDKDGELIHGRMNLQTAGNFAHIFDDILSACPTRAIVAAKPTRETMVI